MHLSHDQAEAERERLRWLSNDELRSLGSDCRVGEILIARLTGFCRNPALLAETGPAPQRKGGRGQRRPAG